ncbi:ferredoxin FixX [Salmonella enterica subsp. enterica serovar Madelia]|nr:ferredoxin FixX [Salmonella enterica subsp. enterica serovar Madelia]
MSSDNKVNVDVKLGVNKFYVDEGHPHIILRSSPDMQEFNKLIKACPAGLYKLDDAGNIHFDSAGCLECGTCRVLCGNTLLEKWEYPAERSALSFATADALKHRITTLRRLIRLAPGDYVICINIEQVNECYINV